MGTVVRKKGNWGDYNYILIKNIPGIEEMPQSLRTLAVLPKDQNSIPIIHEAAQNHLQLQSQGI